MFTDNPTIPAQLEVVLDVVHEMRHRRIDSEALRKLIQPKGLPDLTTSSAQLANHLSAAQELKLVTVNEDKNIRLSYPVKGAHQAKAAIASAFDQIALSDANVEKWAGRFYSYLIVRENDSIVQTELFADEISNSFMQDLPSNVDKTNPMNFVKFRALMRWYVYVGLGWLDLSGAFVPDPTERIRRALPSIWKSKKTLLAEEFMEHLARACPEFDGGHLFKQSTGNAYEAASRQCTRALATALWRLHEESTIKLSCPADSKGWNLDKAGSGVPPGEASNRFDAVDRLV